MNNLTKRYQLWVHQGYGNYSYTEFDTIEECLKAERYTTDFLITKSVDFEVKESK
jgi:hypothetical protein